MNNHLVYLNLFFNKSKLIEAMEALIYNGSYNSFVYYDKIEGSILDIEELIKLSRTNLTQDLPVKLIVKVKNFYIEIIIEYIKDEGFVIKLLPIKPYKIKRNIHGKEAIDLGYYIELALGFCEHFPIWQVHTKEIVNS